MIARRKAEIGRARGRRAHRTVERLETRSLLAVMVNNIPPQIAGVTSIPPFTPIATFDLSDVGATAPSGVTATISWGDHSTTQGEIIPGPGPAYIVAGTHQYTAATPTGLPDPLTVTITNISDDATASGTGPVIVNPAPVHAAGSTFTAEPGIQFSGIVASFTSDNPAARFTDFAAQVQWGDGTTTGFGTTSPTNVTISASPTGGFVVLGTHTYGTNSLPLMTSITIFDLAGPQRSVVQNTTVSGEAIPPTVSAFSGIPQPIVVSANTLLKNVLVGSFTYDYNPGSLLPPSALFASINWGNGNITQGTVVQVPGTEFYNVYGGMNTYTTPGPSSVTVSLADEYGNSGTITSPLTVTTPQITATGTTFTIKPSMPFNGAVATFTDTNPSASAASLTALINWGNGSQSLGMITGTPITGYTVTGTNYYGSPILSPSFLVVVAITGPGGETGTAFSLAIPQNTTTKTVAPFTTTPTSIVAPANTPLNNVLVGSFVYTYTPANPLPSSVPAATINWGNGNVTPGTLVLVPGTTNGYEVFGSQNTYTVAKSYTVTVSLSDDYGNTGTIISPATVIAPQIVATGTSFPITAGIPFTGTVATFTDTNTLLTPGSFVAVINWGDGNESLGTVTGSAATGYAVIGTNYYGSGKLAASYPVTVTITGPAGETGSATSMALFQTQTEIQVFGMTFAVNPDSPFSGTVATFTDPDASAMTTKPTAVINWGNGTVSAGTVMGPDANGNYTVMGAIYYLTTSPTGTYPVTVTITDPSGLMKTGVSLAVMNTPAPPPTLTGGLDLGGENGPSAALGFADTDRPTFSGTTTPFALVQLYANRVDVDATLPLGEVIAGANGSWSLGVGPLSQGIFDITAIVTPAGSSPTGPLPVGPTGLYVIDTTPPAVVGISADGKGHVLVEFQDALSGLSAGTLLNTLNYTFQNANNTTFHPAQATILPGAGLPTDVETVELSLGGGKADAKPKALRITANGILDNAGNPLATSYHGAIPPASYLASSNPVVKVKVHKPKPIKLR